MIHNKKPLAKTALTKLEAFCEDEEIDTDQPGYYARIANNVMVDDIDEITRAKHAFKECFEQCC